MYFLKPTMHNKIRDSLLYLITLVTLSKIASCQDIHNSTDIPDDNKEEIQSNRSHLIIEDLGSALDDNYGPPLFLFTASTDRLHVWLENQLLAGNPISRKFTKSGSIYYIYGKHRQRRQTPPIAGPGAGSLEDKFEKAPIMTPVLPIIGKKYHDDTDCLSWPEVAVILRSGIDPWHKRDMIEDKMCNFKAGLECVPVPTKSAGQSNNRNQGDKKDNAHLVDQTCRCMLSYGPNPVLKTDSNGTKTCYVPAGLGWASECHNKSWSQYGFPLPYGDPIGADAEPAVQVDAYNEQDGQEVVIAYIKWNSINPPCVPHAKCIERGTYIGERCQCMKPAILERPEGVCNEACNLFPPLGLLPTLLTFLAQIHWK